MGKHPRNNRDSAAATHPAAFGEPRPVANGREPDQASVYLDYGPPLPEAYNQDTIVTLIRDPECIFSYWELSDRMVPEIFRLRNLKPASTRWILRAHNLSLKNFYDTELPKPADINNVQGNYYLTVLPDSNYQTELGLLIDQNFISLVKSNIVKTPRKGRSLEIASSPM
ncbi:MAG TPA: DUF4912 domain-containing protein [Planctomycetota bacterium]|nr:DUF4912 domain-containing protein [Planctomycetota bacterium]